MTSTQSEYKVLSGFSRYRIYRHGRVFSLHLKRFLSDRPMRLGYVRAVLTDDYGRCRPHYVHQLVARAFLLPDPLRKSVNHINGIKTDNRVANLEWCTHQENIAHAKRNGFCRWLEGLNHRSCKLGLDDLRVLIEMAESGVAYKIIGSQLGIGANSVSRIYNGKTFLTESMQFRKKPIVPRYKSK